MGGALSRTARRGAPSAVQASVQANEQAVRQAVSPYGGWLRAPPVDGTLRTASDGLRSRATRGGLHTAPACPASTETAGLQRKAQAEAARSAAEPEEKDAQLVSDMNRLMASISSRTEQIYRNPEVRRRAGSRRAVPFSHAAGEDTSYIGAQGA